MDIAHVVGVTGGENGAHNSDDNWIVVHSEHLGLS